MSDEKVGLIEMARTLKKHAEDIGVDAAVCTAHSATDMEGWCITVRVSKPHACKEDGHKPSKEKS